MSGAYVKTNNNQFVAVPDVRVEPSPDNVYTPVLGYNHMLAVLKAGRLLGYVMTEDLGYDDVSAWRSRGLKAVQDLVADETAEEDDELFV